MKILKGTFDGKHIRLEKDVQLQKNSRLLVILLDEEDEKWSEFSSKSISRAYADDEPEYEVSMIKEPNSEYESR